MGEPLLDLLDESEVAPGRGLGLGSIFILLALASIVIIVGIQFNNRLQTQPSKEEVAPDFTMPLYSGGEFRLSEHRGEVILINFWASWCGPCRLETPELQALWEDYGDKGVLIVGVSYADTERGARAFIEEFGVTYPNGPDIGERISDLYHTQGVPESFIIDQNGNIAEFILGRIEYDSVKAVFDRLLAR